MVATPGLSTGSWLAPPRNEKSKAISGTDGLLDQPRLDAAGAHDRWIVVAFAASGAISAAATERRRPEEAQSARPSSTAKGCNHERFSVEGSSLTR